MNNVLITLALRWGLAKIFSLTTFYNKIFAKGDEITDRRGTHIAIESEDFFTWHSRGSFQNTFRNVYDSFV